MAYRCGNYACEAGSIEGLVQQVALSYLRHGYWWYVTGVIPDRKNPDDVDANITSKYGIRKDWRYAATNKRRGIANLQYIRQGRFYVIMATKGLHEFKLREAKRIRDARKCPILVPRSLAVFDGYAISYRRGGFLKKSPAEKIAYRTAVEQWKAQSASGKKLPRPPRGTQDPKWHSCVEIERQSYLRLKAYFLDIGTHRTLDNLAYEITHTGYIPYQPVKRQLVRIIKDVNAIRIRAGCSGQIPYRTVLSLKRVQLSPFEPLEAGTESRPQGSRAA